MKAHQKTIRQILADCIFQLYPACCDDKHINKIQAKLFSLFLTIQDNDKLKNEIKKESLYWRGQDEEFFGNLKLLRMKAFETI